MSIRLPTTSLRLQPERFRSGAWLLSGDGPAGSNPVLGMRELISEANHGYAYRVQTVATSWPFDEAVQFSTAVSASAEELSRIPVEWGLHVAAVRLVARCRHGTIKLRVNDGTTTTTSTGTVAGAALTTVTEEVSLNDATLGNVGYASILVQATMSQTFELVGWVIQEIVLTSGQIP